MTGVWLPTPVPHAIGPRRPHDLSPAAPSGVLHVDCDRCAVRGPACGECVISVLLGPPDEVEGSAAGAGPPDVVVDRVDLNLDEQSALAALAGSGMVPPLRLVTAVTGPDPWSPGLGAEELFDGWDHEADGLDDGWDEAWGGLGGAPDLHGADEDWT